MKLARLIKKVFSRSEMPAELRAGPAMIELMESRMLMSATMESGITDGTSNTAAISARKAGGEQQEYLRYELKNVQITSYQL